MTVRDLQALFSYAYWANRKVFEVIAPLSPEEFTRHVAGSYGSVRNTLVHALSAEWGWLERCGGAQRGEALRPEAYRTPSSLVIEWAEVESEMRFFLGTLSDEDLSRPVKFSIGNLPEKTLPVGDLLQHAFAHGIHHRGQTALLLRSLGHAPGNFDMLVYFSRGKV